MSFTGVSRVIPEVTNGPPASERVRHPRWPEVHGRGHDQGTHARGRTAPGAQGSWLRQRPDP